ncbi:MAG: OmpA family protein [Bacteroidetes bacterium]|nr:OmpA family protein [Bacteroidota bacterium]
MPKEIKSHINQKYDRDAYYFVDDVSLVETIAIEEPVIPIQFEPTTTNEIHSDTLFVFKNVLFKTNETTLLPSSYSELDLLAEYLSKNAELIIEINGHTDNTGNEKKNKRLSNGRAKVVCDYLISKNINKNRLTFTGYGSSKSIASNDTEEGKQQNRRVEFITRKSEINP